ncbi:aquaporin [Ceratitis capitata]|uniref:Aquaporin n=2 Tax=Ceratitis capitata TaxID=7213 RepID=W8AJK3_CERCA|nr:aquaporin [Ceratitis capitata]
MSETKVSQDRRVVREFLGLDDCTKTNMILLATEFFGTLAIAFTFILTMAQQYIDPQEALNRSDSPSAGASMEQIAFGLGLVFAGVSQVLGRRSTCHFNPAVTMSALVVGSISLLMCCLFIIMQCLGSVVGVVAALAILPTKLKRTHLGVPKHPHVSTAGTIIIEALLTFIWVFLAESVKSQKKVGLRDTAPLAVGGTIIVAYFAAYRLTGGCLNPARVFGSALIYLDWEDHWIYWLAPMIGGILGALTYKWIFAVRTPVEPEDDEPDL